MLWDTVRFAVIGAIAALVAVSAGCAPPANRAGYEYDARALPLSAAIDQLSRDLVASARGKSVGKLAVADFAGPGAGISALGGYLSDKLSVRLYSTGAFPDFMERRQLKQVLLSIKKEHSGYFNQDTVQRFGKMIGVDCMVIGLMDDLGPVVDVTAKLVESGTGRLLAMAETQIIKDEVVRELLARRHDTTLTVTVEPAVNGIVVACGIRGELNQGVAVIKGLPPGTCQVLIRPDGHDPVNKTVEIRDQPESLTVRLANRRFNVSFMVNPPTATLVVDGREIALNEYGFASVKGLEAGEHIYKVQAKDHKGRMGTFDPSLNHRVVINLEASDPVLSIGNALAARVRKLASSQDFQVKVWTEKKSYRIGEPIRFFFRAEKDCYLNLIDINSKGEINLLFPNRFDSNNRIRGGVTYIIPGRGYGFDLEAAPPAGMDHIYAIASTEPIDIFGNDFTREAFISVSRGDSRGIEVKMKLNEVRLDSAAFITVNIQP